MKCFNIVETEQFCVCLMKELAFLLIVIKNKFWDISISSEIQKFSFLESFHVVSDENFPVT